MILSNEEVRKIADLARILVSDEDIPQLQERLSRVLTMVEQMNAIDTDGVLPMSHPYEATQRLRLDVVTEINQRELFQQIAPDVGHGLYFVPLVIE